MPASLPNKVLNGGLLKSTLHKVPKVLEILHVTDIGERQPRVHFDRRRTVTGRTSHGDVTTMNVPTTGANIWTT